MMNEPWQWALLGMVLGTQFWATKVVLHDTRFDLLTRIGWVLIVLLLPGPGFVLVHRSRERVLQAREEAMESSRARLGGSLRRRF